MKGIIKELRNKNLITSNCEDVLRDSFSGIPMAMLKRKMSNKKSSKGKKFESELRSFAMTLHYYSVKAYCFVRCVMPT